MKQAAIFDLDGTLVNIPIDYDELFNQIKTILEKSDVQPLLETLSSAKEDERKRIFEIWDKLESDVLQNITPIAEGKAVYERFCENPKALVTMQGKRTVNFITKHFGISFDIEVTREDSLDRARQLELAAHKLNLSIKDALFVGNTDYDAQAAQEVGCQFLRVKH